MLIKCPECANDVSSAASSCPKCGHPILPTLRQSPPASPVDRDYMEYDARKKSVGLAYVFLIFLGGLGIHRFYLNNMVGFVFPILWVGGVLIAMTGNPLGIVMMIGAGGFMLVDLFLLPGLVREYNLSLAANLGTMKV